jgi:shikimate kinase
VNKDLSIGLIGFMGTGKTSVGSALAASLGKEFLDTDAIIEDREGKTVPRIFSEFGEGFFREAEASLVREICTKPSAVISFGGGVLLNPSSAELIKKHTQVVLLTASVETVLNRIESLETRPLIACEAIGIEDHVQALLAERMILYQSAKDIEISTDSLSVDEVVKLIRRRLDI